MSRIKLFNSGGGGSEGLNNLVINEVPQGTVDSTNTTFQLSNYAVDFSRVMLFRNGLLLEENLAGDYICTGSSVVFNNGAIPQAGDDLKIIYQK